MNIIIAPLKIGDTGAGVANLLACLGFIIEKDALAVGDAAAKEKLLRDLARDSARQIYSDNATFLIVRIFQAEHRLPDTGQVDAATAEALNRLLEKLGAFEVLPPPGPVGDFIIRGRVLNTDGTPIAAVTVRAFERDLRKVQSIGNTDTDDLGRYIIRYNTDSFALGDVRTAPRPNLIVRAFAGDRQLGEDMIRAKATSDEVVDFQLTVPVLSEWEIVSGEVIPLLQGQGEGDQALAPWEINEQDLDFISNETGLEREKVSLWATAFEAGRTIAPLLSATGGVGGGGAGSHLPPGSVGQYSMATFAIFYGWFRLGLPTELSALWATSDATLLATLKSAIEQRIVPAMIEVELDEIERRITEVKLDLKLASPGPGGTASLGELFATLPVPPSLAQQRTLSALLPELRHDDPQLVERIASIPGFDGDAVGIARTLRIGALTGGHLPLAQALQVRLAEEKEGALRPLVRLPGDEWLDLAYTHGAPSGQTASVVAYADQLAAEVEHQHPTTALTTHFTEGRRLARQPVLARVGTFLQANPDFDIVTADLNLLAEEAKPEEPINGLRTLQRMSMLNTRWEEAAILLENGLHSPSELLDAGPDQLITRLDGQLSPARIAELHARAEGLQSTALGAFTAATSPLSGPNVLPSASYFSNRDPQLKPDNFGGPGIPPELLPDGAGPHDVLTELETILTTRESGFNPTRYKAPPVIQKVIPDEPYVFVEGEKVLRQPTLRALFGPQDGCACRHCSSVLSPAAYFVDLLQFIKKADLLGVPNESWGLLGRRPDLQDIEVSCDNTNTEVPAIDLALEILENAAAGFPLEVPLVAGVDMLAQLRGQTVGKAVEGALKTTVRSLSGSVRATPDTEISATGPSAWTVVDNHRRWQLIAQPEAGMRVQRGPAFTALDTFDFDLSAWVADLNDGRVGSGVASIYAQLFLPYHPAPPDLSHYEVTITPLVAGRSWRVRYRLKIKVALDDTSGRMVLQNSEGRTFFEKQYNEKTIAAAQAELRIQSAPTMVREVLADTFRGTRGLATVEHPDIDPQTLTWAPQELTLFFTPGRLTITSLAYQSGDSSADALAWPENHNPAAYARLKGDVARGLPVPAFPWSLPVDLPLEEVRLFLERARSSRRRLMELMTPMEPPTDQTADTLEVLSLSEAEGQLIAGALSPDSTISAREVYARWGVLPATKSIFDAAAGQWVKAATALDLLQNVSVLLQQSRLSFAELQTVIETKFVSAGGAAPLRIMSRGSCNPGEMTLPDITLAHLDRIHRLVRLQRRIKWSTQDLDNAIALLSPAEINPATLRELAHWIRLGELLGLPIDKILALQTNAVPIETRMRTLADALEVSSGELSHALLLFQTTDLFAQASSTLAFCQRVKTFSRGGIAFEDLRYLLQHVAAKSADLELDERQRAQLADAADQAVGSVPEAVEKQPPPPETDPERVALRRGRENAVIAALATGLAAPRELVDDLLRSRLRYPLDPSQPAIEVFFATPLFSAGDFIEIERLIGELRRATTPITQYLIKQFSRTFQERIADPASTIAMLEENLVAALNQVAQGASIFDDTAFAGIDLSAETRALILKKPAGAERLRLNRQLLEEAFPKDIRSTRIAREAVLVRLYKTVAICDALKLSPADLRLLREPLSPKDTKGFTALDFTTLPFETQVASAPVEGFEQLLALFNLRTLAPRANALLQQYAALDPADSKYRENAQRLLATGLLESDGTQELEQVREAAAQLGITTVEQYRDPIALSRLIELLTGLRQLEATLSEAKRLVALSPDDTTALSARELLRGKYPDSSWHDLIKPIADQLRTRQRDALVDYLVARDGLRGADDLYERYLIDVQTGSCLKTTRLLQATAAAQLFVQRVILNLEEGLSLDSYKRQLWEWMGRYRVWEANRKVFLFPENWLLPELRDDKSPTFQQLESALTEQEPSPEITRAALLGYVEELGDLAQINVVAMYQDRHLISTNGAGGPVIKRTLYIVGRTPDTPLRYFWRSCTEFGTPEMVWSGWEALELDNANDFIMPFIFEGDLHLAWPIFRKAKEEKKESADSALLFWEIQLAWTRRTNRGWVKRKIGKAQLDKVERLPNKDDAGSFAFRFNKKVLPVPGSPSLTRESITIDCYAAHEVTPILNATPNPPLLPTPVPLGSAFSSQKGYNFQWNVSCNVEGVVYKYVDLPANQGRFYETYEGVDVSIVGATRQSDEFTTEYLPEYITTTRANGAFSFSFPASFSARNGKEGLLNGGIFKLRFAFPGNQPLPHDIDAMLVKKNPGFPDEYALNWNWKINYGVEDPGLAKRFSENRLVTYTKAGEFVFQTGKDLSAQTVATGSAYVSDLDAFTTNNDLMSVRLNPPLAVVRATQSLNAGEVDVWSLRASNDSSYYLQIADSKWRRWPDGQPYVSSYRIDAASSTDALFRLENQGHLHLDPDANNFDRQTTYANYNWELFLHAPLAIADYLAHQQRFEDARRWLHVVFDPTTKSSATGASEFWRFLAFRDAGKPTAIAELLTWLADPNTGSSAVESNLKGQIEQWKDNPFMPHLIARLRPSAYQWHTFFAYLDVLIGWGDQQFRRDTRESVNEATLLYILAAKLLGPRPRVIPAPTPPPPETYRSLRAKNLDELSNAWVSYAELSGIKKLNLNQRATGAGPTQQAASSFTHLRAGAAVRAGNLSNTGIAIGQTPPGKLGVLTSISSLVFCIPQNEKITEYYDRIEERLSNLRNCRNIDGVLRDLPLFEPPIDPLLLIRARAAGLSIDSVLADHFAPLPHYRFSITLQKALDLCAELKSLAAALLSALEKQDGEELALLRSTQEIAMLNLVTETRDQQIAEAEANLAALQQSEATVLERLGQHQKLLGKTSVAKGQDGLPVVEQSSSLSVATDPIGAVSGLGLSRLEVGQNIASAVAHQFTQAANAGHVVAGVLSLIPNLSAGTPFAKTLFGGSFLGGAASAVAKAIEMGATEANYLANQMGTFAGYERRQDEWVYQSKLALAELRQIKKQLLAAEIRKDMATLELRNHETQIANAEKVDEFMHGKFTGKQLYRWMSSQLAEVYFRTYQLALDQAKRAERNYRHELGISESTTPFIQSAYWDSLKKGLMSGERLHHDLKRLEMAYLEQNRREYEITKHISILQIDPAALVGLRETGKCEVALSEALFDLDFSGHYLRRLKMVSLTIPCVVGPYASVPCTLTLIKSSIRTSSSVAGGYQRRIQDGEADSRFSDLLGTVQSIVTSSGQNDSGMFESNLRDERYLPFEGVGAISHWRIELPSRNFPAFDYDTISDVVLHVRYTARSGGDGLAQAAASELQASINTIESAAKMHGVARLFSLRLDFPTEWHRLTHSLDTTSPSAQTFSITKQRFPLIFGNKTLSVSEITLYLAPKAGATNPEFPALKLTLPKNQTTSWPSQPTLVGRLLMKKVVLANRVSISADETEAKWKLSLSAADAVKFQSEIEDILMLIQYTLS